ncbi:MAG TPA: carboxyl transferase domain-containing protein, partial [Gemmatimonadales bacterium]
NSLMRRYLHVPQVAAVMGSCVAGGAYLPALSDVIFMVDGTSFMGLGGPNLVKGATGQVVDAESLGGARTHTAVSGVAHYRADNDPDCLRRIREYIGRLPAAAAPLAAAIDARPPQTSRESLYDVLPHDHRLSYDMRLVLDCLLDAGALDEFQPDRAGELLCGHGRIAGVPVAVIANQRGLIKGRAGEKPRFGGIVYAESAEKAAYFIETANRERIPILFVQDVSGFMVGPDAEHEGIIRAGAQFVEAMATAVVPRIVLTVNHASGAGYYAMAGQGFDPDFIVSWPTGRMAVMEGESAIMAAHGTAIERARTEHRELDPATQQSIDSMRTDYERQLDARYAAARGFVDAIVAPEDSRDLLAFLLRVVANNPGPHLGPFVLEGLS